MKLAGLLLLTVLCFVVTEPTLRAAQLTATCSPGCYGPGLGSDGLANTVVGGIYDNEVSYRFRARHSGALQKIHLYLLPNSVGYSAGTGGKILITVNADDGTSAHNPSSTILASYLLANPLTATPSRTFPILSFPSPPSLVAGGLYHIVFTNVDSSPSTNYLSVDALYLRSPTTPAQPTVSDIDSAVLLRSLGRAWAPRKGYAPILQLDYGDGWTEGIGYMEVWIGAPQLISGTNAVREQFTVSGAQKNVGSVAVRVARLSGTDPLIVRLQDANGTLIEEGNIPATLFPLTSSPSYAWAQYGFLSAHTLLPGKTYHLELAAPSSSLYQAFPIRKGVAYNFKNTTFFPDGYAQFKQGSSWVGWTQWGVTNRTDGDLQFYFELVASDTKPVISGVTASAGTDSATITWTTDQASDSQVEYGVTAAHGSLTPLDSTLTNSHVQTITGLSPDTLYHYRVRSANASGNLVPSSDFTFTTGANLVSSNNLIPLIKDMTFEEHSLTDPVTGADRIVGSPALEISSPLKGTASAKFANTSSAYLEENFTTTADLYLSFYLRILALPSKNPRFMQISNSSTTVGNLLLTSSGRLRLRNASTTIGAESVPLVVGQLYRVALHQKRGAGSNAVLEAFLASGDAAFGAPFATTSSGTWTSYGNRLRLGATNSNTVSVVVDDIRIAADAMPPPSP